MSKTYLYYENGVEETLTVETLITMWNNEIDQSNFADFESWINEMEQMQILN